MMYKKMLVLGLALAISTVTSQVASAAIMTGVERRNSSYDAHPEIAGPLVEGALSYVDRRHQYKRIPVALVGADYIKIANSDKTSLYYELDVTLSQDATLFLLLDNRLGNGYLPANSEKGKLVAPDLAAAGMSWVIDMGFVDTGDDIAIHEYRDIQGKLTDLRWLSVYARDVSAGKITLLPQDNLAVPSNYNMYGVAAISVKVSRDNLGAKGDGFLGEEERLFNPDNRHYYQRIDTAMSWDDAKKYCESLGGHLATVTSVEENAFIYKNFGRDHVCWLGGTDEAEEGKWRWVTGEPFTFQNWYRGQPGNSGKREHYLALGNTRSVIKNGVSYHYRFGASWNDHAAHGRYQGVTITFPVCEWDGEIKVSSEGGEWSLSNLSTIRRIVPNGWKGSWSPDGLRLVFGKPLGKGLQILDTESGKTTDLTPSGKDPAWSPDGRFIAYIKEQRFNAYMSEEVWIVEPTGQSPRKIADAGYPHWSADGKLLFVQSRKENKIFTIDIDNLDAKAKVLYDGPQSWYPAVSSDGKRIAFGKNNALVVIDIEIGQTVLTWPTPGNRGLLPAWSPDGNLVAYGGFDNVSSGLWVLDMRTEEAVMVSKGPCTMPAWSMDGTKLAFDLRSGNRREIWVAEKKPVNLRKPPQRPVDRKPDKDNANAKPIPVDNEISIGKPFPELEFNDLDGNAVSISKLKGKVVLIDFWATWCRPCTAETPNLLSVYEDFKDKGFEIIGISLDSDRQRLNDYLKKHEIAWPNFYDGKRWNNEISSRFGVRSIPKILLLDSEGIVKEIGLRGDRIREKVSQLIEGDSSSKEVISPPYAPTGKLTFIDVESKANGKLTVDPHGTGKNNNLRELTQGEQTFGDVKFRIVDALMQLTGGYLRGRPEKIEGIPVNKTFTRLYILHGTQRGFGPDGTLIGEYRLHYEDETQETIPIILGEDVRDWWNTDQSKPVSRGKVAWIGQNEDSRKKNQMLRLYLAAWDNPHPDKKVVSIDYISTKTTASRLVRPAPFCIAMTVEEANEQDDANAQTTPDKEEGDRVIATPSVPARAAWTTLVPARSVWKYLDDGSIQGTAWYEPGFDDSSWASGPAELGYGDGNEATVVSYGMEEDYKYPTTYFRHSFNVPDASIYQSLLLAVLRDDGAVVYLNGTEIFRTNMPGGDIDYSTAASTGVKSRAESTFYDIPLRAKSLVNGNNVLAVEIHQVSDISTDISFDLSLAASTELVDALVATDSMEEALADGLVAHWTFDERDGNEVYDAKGGNDGIIYGAKWVNGLFGGALSFDGDGDYISIKEKTLPKAGPYSISLWLRADGDYKSKYNVQGHDQNACWFHYYVSDKARFTLGSTTGGSGRTVIRGADNRTFGNYRLDNNRWAHMVVVFDSEGKAVKFYNNSAEARNRNTPTTVNYRDPGWAFSGTDVVIGSRGGASPWYNGLMDDIRIYDRALSGPEVKGLYQSGLSAEADNQEQDDQQDKVVSPPEEEGRVLAIDDFDGKLSLDWKIQNPDDSHYSLTNKPGTLNITTQKGDFYRLNTNYKNLFLIDNPVAVGEDFEITTCLLSFVPVGNFNQAGLVCFNDEDNYIKWTYEWNGARRQQVFALIRETRGRVAPHTYVGGVPKAERIWLRLTNRGNRYTYSSSTDGKSFREHGTLPWGDRAPKWVGLMAFNGPTSDAPEIDASFDFFEVRAIPAKAAVPAAAKAATFVIPEENLKIPEEMKACAENLQKMHTAIKKYEEDKDKLPNWLSDLVPDYITNDALLCSNDARHKAKYSPDPKLPCSYSWELSSARIPGGWDPTRRTQYRDWKTQQIKLFGDVVPMVRCHHHGSKKVLNLSVGSQIYWGRLSWEFMFKPDYRFGDESPERQRRGIQLAGQLRITGVVRDEAGMPVDGVEISILPSGGRDFRVDAEGEFEVSWQPRSSGGRQSDNYLVARHRERNLVAVVRIDKDTDTLEIKLGPGVIFTGKVVDPEGEGIAGARIMTMLRVSNWGSSFGGPAETDGEGQFEIRAIPPEHRCSVFATAEGYGQRHVEVRTDDAVDNRVDVGQLTLAVADLSVSGVVVDAEDKPVADARVYCYGEGQSGSSTKTDAEGKFTLEKICAGKLRISVSVQGKTRLYGNVETEGGATNVKVVVSERDALAARDVPKLPVGPEPAPDAIVFDMAYRGLDAGEDELRYNSYWGYGGGRNDKGNPFIKAVEKVAGNIETVYNPNFKGAEWSALELAGDKPVALYFDMNANGKLADNEKILPAGEPDESDRVEFVTPDFMMTTRDGSRVPFRVLLQARKGGNSMWSPSCVLQGASTINDKKVRMLLFCNGLAGTFTQFGRGSYSLVEQEPNEGHGRVSRQTLSSLINYDDQFYRLRFLKSAEKEGPMRLVLEKDTGPTGELAVKLAGAEGLKARLGSVRITGSRDSTISFSVSGDKGIKLPAGEYKIASGSIYYGSQKDDEWYVSFSGEQKIEIKGGEHFTSELGEPRILVSALDQKDRYRSNAEEKAVYAKGTTIFLSPKVKGKSGELYSRFRRSESKSRVDVCPTVEITDSDGKQIASSKMEYG